MPFTQSQTLDIKALIQDSIKDILANREFIENTTSIIAKSVDQKIDNILKTYGARCDELEKENATLREKVEQYTRRNTVRILGLPEKNSEDTKVVVDLCKEKLKVDILSHNVDRVHRVGPRRMGESKRGVILKFTNHWCKTAVLKNRHRLKGTGVLIFEDLTKYRHHLYKTAQQKYGAKNTYTLDGTIFVKIGDMKHKINSRDDLVNIK
ncbi:hypothetical protein QE152_g32652 [Popillia japonica]|uniref:Uncharacterized protein n=1 Tax=Popillia japonica TaxID=7064 RepID=A0AAW1IYN3_POPJA